MGRGFLVPAAVVAALAALAWAAWISLRKPASSSEARTVAGALREFEPIQKPLLQQAFSMAHVPYPPEQLVLVAFKRERRLEVHAAGPEQSLRLVFSLPILAASGVEGPKLREGDRQVPEGFYRIELLNPNSRYHLSLRVNYPSPEDISQARKEGRDLTNLGGDIMIHGGDRSAGCLAIGDPAVEKIFVLVARTGLDATQLVIAPCDLRVTQARSSPDAPKWTPSLHNSIEQFLQKLESPLRGPWDGQP